MEYLFHFQFYFLILPGVKFLHTCLSYNYFSITQIKNRRHNKSSVGSFWKLSSIHIYIAHYMLIVRLIKANNSENIKHSNDWQIHVIYVTFILHLKVPIKQPKAIIFNTYVISILIGLLITASIMYNVLLVWMEFLF